MRELKVFFSSSLWRSLFAGPLRVKVMIEREDGTELYHFYPLDTTVTAGQTVHLDFEVGIQLHSP